MLISTDAEFSCVQVSEQFLLVYQTSAAYLLQFDVPTVNVSIEGRLAASEQQAGFLDRDEVVAWPVRDLLVNSRFDGCRYNRLEYVSKEFSDGSLEFHVS